MRAALITGCFGFIDFFVSKRLLSEGFRVLGLEAMADYYAVLLKQRHVGHLLQSEHFQMARGYVETRGVLVEVFETEKPDLVIHLSAQADARHSIESSQAYLESNIAGTFELLEPARAYPPQQMLIESTSSEFGANTDMPCRQTYRAGHQMSFYAATKKSTENMAHSYANLFDLPISMFRFFAVYSPWGWPDIALFKFNEVIRLLINARTERPAVAGLIPESDDLSSVAPWHFVNIDNTDALQLTDCLYMIDDATGRNAERNLMPKQAGDAPDTWANAEFQRTLTGHAPSPACVPVLPRLSDGIGNGIRLETGAPLVLGFPTPMRNGLRARRYLRAGAVATKAWGWRVKPGQNKAILIAGQHHCHEVV